MGPLAFPLLRRVAAALVEAGNEECPGALRAGGTWGTLHRFPGSHTLAGSDPWSGAGAERPEVAVSHEVAVGRTGAWDALNSVVCLYLVRCVPLLTSLMVLVACAGDSPPPAPKAETGVLAPMPDALLAMGSGAATPLLQALARAYGTRHPRLPVRVEPSVGTAGGIAAARDGAVDLGLVGRALGPGEAPSLERVSVARDAVIFAAAPDVERDGLTRDEVRRLYAGDRTIGLTLLLRDPQETANEAVERAMPDLRELREAATRAGRFRVLDHDDAMAHTLLTTPHALGVFSFGAIRSWRLPLRPMSLDGVVPSVESLENGTWPAIRTVGIVFRSERRSRVSPFLAFIFSPEGKAVSRSNGFLPLPEGGQ